MIKILGIMITLVLCLASVAVANEIDAKSIDGAWDFYGSGVKRVEHGMLYIKEGASSNGVVLVSPEAYDEKVVLRFEVMPLSAACVLEVVMSAGDIGEEGKLRVPYKYGGGIKYWKNKVECYVFEFNNLVFNDVPNLMKYPNKEKLGKAEGKAIEMGKFNLVEVGRHRDNFWLTVNGVRLFKIDDDHEFDNGHIALRIRGLIDERASCLIKNVSIEDR